MKFTTTSATHPILTSVHTALIILAVLFSWAGCSQQTPFEEPHSTPVEATQANLSITWEGTRINTANTTEGTALAWQASDVLHLAITQNGVTHYVEAPVTLTDNPRRAKVRFTCPNVNFTQPYDLCGFVGGATWQNTSPDIPPVIKLTPQTTLLPSLNAAAGVLTIIFGAQGLTTQTPIVTARMVGNIYKFTIENYSKDNQQYNALGLSVADWNDHPFYNRAATTLVNPYTGVISGTTSNQQLFTLSAPLTLAPGEQRRYYACLLTTPQAKGIRVRPSIQSGNNVLHENADIHTIPLPTAGNSVRSIHMVQTNGGLYTKTPQKPILPADLTGPDFLGPYLNKWMSLYPDNYPLIKLFVPGTHDTEAVRLNAFQALAQCQETHLADQLEKGVRAVDIRLYVAHDRKLWVCHGSLTYTWIEFEEGVLKVMIDFLRAHPTETIFFMVKDDRNQGADWVRKILGYIGSQQYYPAFVTDLTPRTTLGEVRGKLVLLSRNTLTGLHGGGINFQGWGDNANHTVAMTSYKTGATHLLWSQDVYKDVTPTEKADYVKQTLQESIDRYYKGIWTINYSSLSGNPGNNAAEINPLLVEYLKSARTPFYGLLYTDFITRGGATQGPELMKQILWNQLLFLTR